MDVPETVATALADRAVAGKRCLEAGAGAGNATLGLLAAGAREVLAVTDDREHAATVRERVAATQSESVRTIEADLRDIPLADETVEVVTAHALCNVVTTAELPAIADELTRVAAPGAQLVVDDYAPLPDRAAMADIFALENAAGQLADGRPPLTFYPESLLRSVFESRSWTFQRRKALLDPVPWTETHVEAHADVARAAATSLDGDLGDALAAEADRLIEAIGSESVGEMYSLAFRLDG
ncbi:class I SAM-dependent methyltransferase [Halorhabdus sp. CUG00001]|uniref:class I SAM-dependent methyltransferase n=1 Tax=Halorhabdus sp. CUG00001 TaxID=2600297 RepID=UPI00131CA284|nr:class I SAM-dependent methyltransferase [Halorhabdus sp. CUG00001]